jgi:alpha-tubulin suppressor-like RCC1 family protein
MNARARWGIVVGIGLVLALLFSLRPRFEPVARLPAGSLPAKVALGTSHGVILAPDGSLWVWGSDGHGWPVLGLGTNRDQPSLRRIGRETNWVDVAVGGSHTLALKSDGTIWGWGENLSWQLGDGTRTARPTPVRTVPGNDWKQVATGLHSLALKKDGTLWAWGNNWAGVLGNGSTNNSLVPLQVGSATNWTRVWANGVQSVGLQSDGSLWGWGYQLLQFNQTEKRILVPTRLTPDTNWVDVGMGDFMAFAVKSDGTLWAWGSDADIYTGLPDSTLNATPRQVGTNTDWRACAPFWNSCTLFMKKDGSLWALDDVQDQRSKRINNPAWKIKPVSLRRIALEKDIVAFAGGQQRLGVAITREGEVWTWGLALGESHTILPLRLLSRVVSRLGLKVQWGGPVEVRRDQPWQLHMADPNVPKQ